MSKLCSLLQGNSPIEQTKGRKRNRCAGFAVFHKVVREDIAGKVTFKQR